MKTASLLSAGLCALGVLASEPLTLDKVEADIKTSEYVFFFLARDHATQIQ